MPEGDTLFKTASTLRKVLANKIVLRFDANPYCLLDRDRISSIVHRQVFAVEARGKHLLIVFRDLRAEPEPMRVPDRFAIPLIRSDVVLHTHLRMTGSWHIYRPGEAWRKPFRLMKVAIHTDEFIAPCFSAPVVDLLGAREAVRLSGVAELGPDATTDDFDLTEAKARVCKRADLEIGVALMNQRAMAGVGNVYKSEVLFIRRISPFSRVVELSDETVHGLIAESAKLLQANRNEGSRRTTSFLNPRERLWVYGRTGDPCRVCSATIRVTRQGLDGRVTFYCPRCQAD